MRYMLPPLLLVWMLASGRRGAPCPTAMHQRPILPCGCSPPPPMTVQVVGEGRCPILDTWWQTETGTVLITPLPYAWALKPGCATLPFFGE